MPTTSPTTNGPASCSWGADDAGRPIGLPITDALLRQLADIKTDGNIVPPPTLTVSKQVLAGHEVAVVTVQPADSPPVRYRGRTWIRVGPRRAVASLQDERILNEKRRHRESSFDAHPAPGARLTDLDLRYFEDEYLPRAIDAATLEQNDRSTIERLASMKMLASADDPRPTMCGILILGKHPRDFLPGAYVQGALRQLVRNAVRRELRANQQPDPLFKVTPQRVFCTVQAHSAAQR